MEGNGAGRKLPDQPFYFAFVIGLSLLGLLHLMQGRGDTRSAWRFGLYACGVVTVVALFDPASDHRGSISIFRSGAGAIAALTSLAIEPWTRRLVAARDDHMGTLAGGALARSRCRS